MIDSEQLTAKLRKFAEARSVYQDLKAQAEAAEVAYRQYMNECIELMMESGLSSLNIVGTGTFTLRGRNYSRIIDWNDFVEWAIENGVGSATLTPEGRWKVEFVPSRREAIVEGVKTEIITLENGSFSLEVTKTNLNELSEEVEGDIPGVTQFTTRYITVYQKK